MNGMLVSPPNFYVKALIDSVVVFGDGASKKVTKVKWDHKDGVLIW